MSHIQSTNFVDRQKAAAEAKKAMLAKFQPKPMVTDPLFAERAAMKAAELERAREERAAAKAAKKQAIADAEQAARDAALLDESAILAAKRSERKERKQLTKAKAKAKRDARYAAKKGPLIMARKPNYSFERQERERQKALKLAQKAEAKREQREAGKVPSEGEQGEGE